MLKVVAGKYRGRLLEAPGEETVPTKNIVRTGISNAIAFDLPGARVLDLFAGSGAFGIEALSRGASFCDFVDASADAQATIRKNLAKLGIHNAAVHGDDFREALKNMEEPFDIVLLDPPYKERGFYGEAIALLKEKGLLAKNAAVILEYEGEEPDFLNFFERKKEYRYGRTRVTIVRNLL